MDLPAILKNALLQARFRAGRLGTPGVIGIALLAFCGMFFFSALVPAEAELELLSAQLRQAARVSQPGARQPDAAAQLQELLRRLRRPEQVVEDVMRLSALGEQHQLSLRTGEYKYQRDAQSGVAAYQISLPVRGSYPQVRGFVADVLTELPAITLDEIALKREAIVDNELDARLRFSLHVWEARP